ncbi:MAG TPA: polyprenol monophosphomannose synthase [Candidatus Paceibacterota bacterium]
MRVTIIIPTYNEAANIGELIKRIRATVPEVDILVVDDNSPDGTGRIVEEIASNNNRVQLLKRAGKEGLGKAYIAGFKKVLAEGEVTHIVMMDADLSHDPIYLPKMFALARDYDVVVGSRYLSGGGTVGWELWRRILSRLGNYYAHFVTGLPVRDCTGGFNLISVKYLEKIMLSNVTATGYAFIMEIKFIMYTLGAKFVEIPIIFKNRTGGQSKLSGKIIKEGVIAPLFMRLGGGKRFLGPDNTDTQG